MLSKDKKELECLASSRFLVRRKVSDNDEDVEDGRYVRRHNFCPPNQISKWYAKKTRVNAQAAVQRIRLE